MEFNSKPFDQLSLDELYEILQVRVAVFVVEQNCPYQEIDGKDRECHHLFYRMDGKIQAYLRVVPPGISYPEASIGRVLTVTRGGGLGKKMMQEGIRLARELYPSVNLRIGAQVYAKGFYEQFGFRQCSEEYLEDEIPHIEMLLE